MKQKSTNVIICPNTTALPYEINAENNITALNRILKEIDKSFRKKERKQWNKERRRGQSKRKFNKEKRIKNKKKREKESKNKKNRKRIHIKKFI